MAVYLAQAITSSIGQAGLARSKLTHVGLWRRIHKWRQVKRASYLLASILFVGLIMVGAKGSKSVWVLCALLFAAREYIGRSN